MLGSIGHLYIIGVGGTPRLVSALGCSVARECTANSAELSKGPVGLEGRSGSKVLTSPGNTGSAR